jgi:Putative cyclase
LGVGLCIANRWGVIAAAASSDGIDVHPLRHAHRHVQPVWLQRKDLRGFFADEYLGGRAWTKCGAEKDLPILVRGVLLDAVATHGIDRLPPSHPIGKADLEACLKHQGTELRPGDVVWIRTGQMNLWPDIGFVRDTPGLNRHGTEYLAKHGAVLIGG